MRLKSSTAVVDHLVRAHRQHEVLLAGVVDTSHVSAEPLGELDRERPRPSACPVDQHPGTLDGLLRALQGDRAGLRDRRRLGERELRRLVGECGLRSERVLREAAHQREVVAVHLVAGAEAGHPFADLVDHAGDVRSERPLGRGTQPTEPRVRRRSGQALPVAEVERGRCDLDAHLPGGGRRHRDVLDAQARRAARTGRGRPPSRPPCSAPGHGGNLADRRAAVQVCAASTALRRVDGGLNGNAASVRTATMTSAAR